MRKNQSLRFSLFNRPDFPFLICSHLTPRAFQSHKDHQNEQCQRRAADLKPKYSLVALLEAETCGSGLCDV